MPARGMIDDVVDLIGLPRRAQEGVGPEPAIADQADQPPLA